VPREASVQAQPVPRGVSPRGYFWAEVRLVLRGPGVALPLLARGWDVALAAPFGRCSALRRAQPVSYTHLTLPTM
jgi:hypothetical protein